MPTRLLEMPLGMLGTPKMIRTFSPAYKRCLAYAVVFCLVLALAPVVVTITSRSGQHASTLIGIFFLAPTSGFLLLVVWKLLQYGARSSLQLRERDGQIYLLDETGCEHGATQVHRKWWHPLPFSEIHVFDLNGQKVFLDCRLATKEVITTPET